jgi:aspartate/methionine/tyrosine aminotransferase
MITSGTSGGLLLAMLATLNAGDEVIFGDPYFVIYPAHATLCGAKAVCCDTYADFRLTAERAEPLITKRTKLLIVNSPGNPSGIVLNDAELRDLTDLCLRRNVLLVSDEIYDLFTYDDALEHGKCPSPARFTDQALLIRGFGKSYGCTGWRLGYAAGPKPIIQQMLKLQQYTFTCAPSMAQVGLSAAFDVDMSPTVRSYQNRRDIVVEGLAGAMNLNVPGGAFYAFAEVPRQLGLSATQFAQKAIERGVLVIPGGVFSRRDTHIRISFATSETKLRAGLGILRDLASGR